jgi:transposase
MEKLAEAVHEITGKNVELAYVDQGYTVESAAQAAEKYGVQLEVVKHTRAKRAFVLSPRRWVLERSFAWAPRFRKLARDYERISQTLAGLPGLRHPHARQSGQTAHAKFITSSSH